MRRWLLLGALVAVAAGVIAVAAVILMGHGSNDATGRRIVAAGEIAPTFELKAADGTTVSLAQYRGSKNVLLYFSMAYG